MKKKIRKVQITQERLTLGIEKPNMHRTEKCNNIEEFLNMPLLQNILYM